ncbi:MAG: hypothetical protein ABSE73_13310 [Planctomycetota bacterium]
MSESNKRFQDDFRRFKQVAVQISTRNLGPAGAVDQLIEAGLEMGICREVVRMVVKYGRGYDQSLEEAQAEVDLAYAQAGATPPPPRPKSADELQAAVLTAMEAGRPYTRHEVRLLVQQSTGTTRQTLYKRDSRYFALWQRVLSVCADPKRPGAYTKPATQLSPDEGDKVAGDREGA